MTVATTAPLHVRAPGGSPEALALAHELADMNDPLWAKLLPGLRRVATAVAPRFVDVQAPEDTLGELALAAWDGWLAEWAARVRRNEEHRSLHLFLRERLRDRRSVTLGSDALEVALPPHVWERELPLPRNAGTGRTRTRTAPPAAPSGQGTLTINTIPWARVFIDGRDTGRTTPVRGLRVPAGRHRLGLRTSDGTMHRFEVTVRAGEQQRIIRRL